MNKYGITVLLSLISISFSFAQEVEMADEMRADGKIYVVVTVLSIIFLGIVAYLIKLDRKISRLEKEASEKK